MAATHRDSYCSPHSSTSTWLHDIGLDSSLLAASAGKLSLKGLLAPFLLLVAAALLIFSEVFIRSTVSPAWSSSLQEWSNSCTLITSQQSADGDSEQQQLLLELLQETRQAAQLLVAEAERGGGGGDLKKVVARVRGVLQRVESSMGERVLEGGDGQREEAGGDGSAADIIMKAWERSPNLQLREKADGKGEVAVVPNAPHVEDCGEKEAEFRSLDSRDASGSLPVWPPTRWSSLLGQGGGQQQGLAGGPYSHFIGKAANVSGPYPPWVSGADEDSLLMTRSVQHDIWLNQHPANCSSPDVKFFIVNAVQMYSTYLGVGAQISLLSGALAEAMREGRVMVIKRYERAEHEGCQGAHYGRWSCYFAAETSEECRQRALQLEETKAAKKFGVVTFASSRYPKPNRFFFYQVPDLWGAPWNTVQSTVAVNRTLIGATQSDALRWWNAQATRYLLRSTSARLCLLLNRARHEAWGADLAAAAAASLPSDWRRDGSRGQWLLKATRHGIEEVWRRRGAFVPPGVLSLHVRQGDKAIEMKLVSFKRYMQLASLVRSHFPHVTTIWLSTEMQEVVNEARKYPHWRFLFTSVPRQHHNMSMREYEQFVGESKAIDNAFVNLFIAASCDFFVGTMGSTWSVLIDNLRVTSGKQSSGFISVNKDRYWFDKPLPFPPPPPLLQKPFSTLDVA